MRGRSRSRPLHRLGRRSQPDPPRRSCPPAPPSRLPAPRRVPGDIAWSVFGRSDSRRPSAPRTNPRKGTVIRAPCRAAGGSCRKTGGFSAMRYRHVVGSVILATLISAVASLGGTSSAERHPLPPALPQVGAGSRRRPQCDRLLEGPGVERQRGSRPVPSDLSSGEPPLHHDGSDHLHRPRSRQRSSVHLHGRRPGCCGLEQAFLTQSGNRPRRACRRPPALPGS